MNLSHHRVIKEGDLVILYERKDSLIPITVTKGEKYSCILGAFIHDQMIGKEYGCLITSQTGNKYLYALEPTPELWSACMKTRTQIIFTLDASVIIFNLFIKPGSRVVESGTGSGALSTDIARVLYPTGHLFTFEYNEMRANEARAEFQKNGLNDLISVYHRDAYEDGFVVESENSAECVDETHPVDAVFLDLPKPYAAIQHANRVLRRNGRICCFSPCIEQVQENCKALRDAGYELIETLEVLLREYELNSIDNNNSYTVKNRNAKKRDAPTADNVTAVHDLTAAENPSATHDPTTTENPSLLSEQSPSQGTTDPRLGAFMAHLGVPNLQTASELKPESLSTTSVPLFIGSKSITECMSTMALAKGEHIGRGHTAYLTFATKILYKCLYQTIHLEVR